MATKTDNHDPRAKLELRRYMIRKYHAGGPIDVLDCCQGSGVLWGQLRQEFPVTSYWGVDVKPKKGRLKLDSVRILQQAGWPQNVVDVDTYGSPFRHWLALLPNLSRPTTVLLTIGRRNIAHGNPTPTNYGLLELDLIGIGGLLKNLDSGTRARLLVRAYEIIASTSLTRACDYATIIECAEAVCAEQGTRYIGVRLEPLSKTNGRGTGIPGRSEHEQPQEVAHV